LADYDEAVAIQAAGLLVARGDAVAEESALTAAAKAGPHVASGFRTFLEAWRESQIARRR
jgi:hypothetical protein